MIKNWRRKQAERILRFMLEAGSEGNKTLTQKEISKGAHVGNQATFYRLHDLFMGGFVDYYYTKGVFPSEKVWFLTESGRKNGGYLNG